MCADELGREPNEGKDYVVGEENIVPGPSRNQVIEGLSEHTVDVGNEHHIVCQPATTLSIREEQHTPQALTSPRRPRIRRKKDYKSAEFIPSSGSSEAEVPTRLQHGKSRKLSYSSSSDASDESDIPSSNEVMPRRCGKSRKISYSSTEDAE